MQRTRTRDPSCIYTVYQRVFTRRPAVQCAGIRKLFHVEMFFSSFFRFFALSRGQCDRWIVFFFHGFMERPWVNAIAIAKFVIYRNIYICLLNICKQQFTNDFSTDTATRLLKPCSANKRISSQKLLASLSLSNKSIPA